MYHKYVSNDKINKKRKGTIKDEVEKGNNDGFSDNIIHLVANYPRTGKSINLAHIKCLLILSVKLRVKTRLHLTNISFGPSK